MWVTPRKCSELIPELPYLKMTNLVTTGEAGSGDQVYIYTSPLGDAVRLTGTVPRGASSFAVKGAVPNPAYAAAFCSPLPSKSGRSAWRRTPDVLPVSGAFPTPRTVLDQYNSPTLRDLCQQTNWWSINLYADAFLKTVGQRLGGKTGI